MKKSDNFRQGADMVSKKIIDSGKSFVAKIKKSAGRQSIIGYAMLAMTGLATTGLATGLIMIENKPTAKKEVMEKHPLVIPMLYFLGLLLCMYGTDPIKDIEDNKKYAINTLMIQMNIPKDPKRAALVFGMLTNYMTDAEYNEVLTIISQWQKAKVKDGEELKIINQHINKIVLVLNTVMDRNIGLRDTLRQIAMGDKNINTADFIQEAKKIHAQAGRTTSR